MALKFNTFRSKRYLRSRYVEGKYLLAAELTDVELELVDFARRLVKSSLGDHAIGDAWKVQVLSPTTLLVSPGEAWYDGFPFSMRGGKDHLVSGSQLAMGLRVVPGGGTPYISAADDSAGLGKIITFNDSGLTPSAEYQVVISAKEEVVTNVDDPFLKNANIPESTVQKVRTVYKLNVVPKNKQNTKSIPYDDTTTDGNLSNYIEVIPQSLGNGSEVSRTTLSGAEQLDGRNIEIVIRNNTSSANPLYSGSPVGNPIPVGSSEQSEFANGKFIDSLGREYHLNAIFNDTVANQVVLRIDKEVDQEDPDIIVGSPYRLVKRDVFVTDDVNGTPQGQLFWPIANVVWDQVDGFVHDSVVEDLRKSVKNAEEQESLFTTKGNLKVIGGGDVSLAVPTAATGSITVGNNSFDAGDSFSVNGKVFTYLVDWEAGATANDTATNIAAAINDSTDPLIENVVSAQAVGNAVNITAKAGGTGGNSIALAESDGATDNLTLSGVNLSGGVDGTPGHLMWDSAFAIINPHNIQQSIAVGEAVLLDGGCLAYLMDLENGGTISNGSLAITTTSTGSVVDFPLLTDLSAVKVGNTLLVGQTAVAITAVDNINKQVSVSPSIGVMGAGYIFLDTYAEGTLPLDANTFVLAVRKGTSVLVEGKGGLSASEVLPSTVPQQLLDFIGSTGDTDDSPNYSSTFAVNDGDSLTEAVSNVDEYVEDLDKRLELFKIEKHATTPDRAMVLPGEQDLLKYFVQAAELNSYVIDFEGAVIDFATGTIYENDEVTVLGNNFTPYSIPAGHYFWYGLGAFGDVVTGTNRMSLVLEVTNATSSSAVAANAPYPLIIGSRKLGAIQIYNDAGTLRVNKVSLFSQAGSGSGSGSGFIKVDLYDPVSTTLPTGASPTIDGQTLLENQLVFFSNLSVGSNRVYKATNVLTSVVWAVQKIFENSSETPYAGDALRVKSGDLFAGQIVYIDESGNRLVNDVTRFFDGDNGTDYWELGSIKTTTLVDNLTSSVFTVAATASENWIVNFSINRNGIKEVGQIYITHDGANAVATTSSAYTGATGVTFSAGVVGPNLVLVYTTTNTGSNATMKFYTQRWSDSAGGPSGVPSYSAYVSSVPAAGVTGDVQYKGSTGDLDADPFFKWDSADKAINLNGYKLIAQQTGLLLDNQAVPVSLITTPIANKWMIVEYSLQRDADTQVGQLFVTNNGTIASLSDSSVATVLSLGVTFSADISGGNMRVLYATTATGFNASFKYTVKRWS